MLAKKIMAICAAACIAAVAPQARAFEWTGLAKDSARGGRMVSPGYLRGKTVILDIRDYADPASENAIRQLQATWAAYKTKSFIVLGSHRGTAGADQVRSVLERAGATYPVYYGADAEGSDFGESGAPAIRVIDTTCTRRLYSGRDPRIATGIAANAIFSARLPSAPKQWKHLLDWEIENLPGQALLRLKALAADKKALAEMKSAFPEDAKRYSEKCAEFSATTEIKKLANLVELSRLVKDRDSEADKSKKIRPEQLDRFEEKFGSLKKSDNPFVAQEAKNALADVAFAKFALPRADASKKNKGSKRTNRK